MSICTLQLLTFQDLGFVLSKNLNVFKKSDLCLLNATILCDETGQHYATTSITL